MTPSMNDLQREIHMRHPLMDTARADDVDIWRHVLRHIIFRQPAADLDEEKRSPRAMRPGFEPARHARRVGRREIIQHDDVRPGAEGFLGVGFGLAFDLDFEAEAGGGFGGRDGAGDGSRGPDVVVF